MPGDPFQIDSVFRAPLCRVATVAARPLLSWLLGLRSYRKLYERTQSNPAEPFERRALKALDIQPRVPDEEAGLIPTRGQVLIASNHPHGALVAGELLNNRGQAVTVRLGLPLAAGDLVGGAGDAAGVTLSIRRAVEELGQTVRSAPDFKSEPHAMPGLIRANTILAEIEHLSNESCLVDSGAFQV